MLGVGSLAHAQTTVLVSNIGKANSSTGSLGSDDHAQGFTTGGNSGGYTLTSVEIAFGQVADASIAYAVSIRADNSSSPGSSMGSLTAPATLAANAVNTFTTSGIDLVANTTYFVLVDSSSAFNNQLRNTESDDEDSGRASGWSIGNSSLYRSRTAAPGALWTTFNQSKKIRINGTVTGGTTSTDATLSGLVLNDGTNDLTLTPTFATDTTSYTESVANDIDRITVAPETNDDGASFEYLDASDAPITDADGMTEGHQLDLAEGAMTTETYTVTVARAEANNAPVFTDEATLRSVAENTASNMDIGTAVSATDADSDTLTYSLQGTDEPSFTIVSTSGQLQTSAALDHEAKESYSVTVKAEDGKGGSDTIAVVISITDVNEPPAAPAAPMVSATTGTLDSLDVSWTAPDNAGKPEITGYRLRYRVETTTGWTFDPEDHTGTSATIGNLTADTTYEVRVRATNDEGRSAWSDSGTGFTDAPVPITPPTPQDMPRDWDLIPTGLGGGDSFRLLFVRHVGTEATSSDINFYNEKVQKRAGNGHTSIRDYSSHFRALASTDSVDARDNTATTGAGVPIYYLNGDKVADNYADFYDGSWNSTSPTNFRAEAITAAEVPVWTGSGADGTAATLLGAPGSSGALGTPGVDSQIGRADLDGFQISHGDQRQTTTSDLYGLSPVFTVTAGTDATLNETFASDTYVYTSNVTNSVTSVTVAAETHDSNASFEYRDENGTEIVDADGGATGHQVNLAEGANLINIKVTAEDANTILTYRLTVTRTPAVPVCAVTVDPDTIAEADTGVSTVTVSTGGVSFPDDQTITLAFTDSTATLTDDYLVVAATLTLTAGTTSVTTTITAVDDAPNNAPVFAETSPAARSVAENTAAEQDIGTALSATDADNDTLTYTLEGTDAASFDIVSGTGQIQTKAALDYETKSSYDVTVKADDGQGGSATIAVTISITDVLEAPGAPTGLMAAAMGETQIVLSWTAPTHDGGADITGYRIEWSEDDDGPWTVLVGDTGSTSTSYTDTVTPGTIRWYRVFAINSVGAGAVSPTPASGVSGGALTVAWASNNPPAEHRGGTGVDLLIEFSENISGSASDRKTAGAVVTNAEVLQFKRTETGQNTRLTIRLTATDPAAAVTFTLPANRPCTETGAICTSGDKRLSNELEATLQPPRPPGMPTDLRGTADGETAIDLEWTAPADIGSGNITGYRIEWSADGSTNWADLVADTGNTNTTYADEGLTPGTTRHYRVSAINRAGPGDPSVSTEASARSPLTAAFENLPASHGGAGATFTFNVRFSEFIETNTAGMRDSGITVTNGSLTRTRRVDGQKDYWVFDISPASTAAVTITFEVPEDCVLATTICTIDNRPLSEKLEGTVVFQVGAPSVPRRLTADARATEIVLSWDAPLSNGGSAITGYRIELSTDAGGTAKTLTSAATRAVAAVPLTASFTDMPAKHDGESVFTFKVQFSEGVASKRAVVRSAFTVSGGAVSGLVRQGGSARWQIKIEPSGHGDISIALPAKVACSAGGLCTADGRRLSKAPRATVQGPVGIAVADARVDENTNAALAFAVTLSRAASGTVTVDYATADGTATAGTDYAATSGTLRFAVGETSKTVSVTVLDDLHDEGEETLTLTLSNASGGRLTDGTATGTIENTDPLPRGLMARFGRAAALHVVEHVQERIEARREPGIQTRFAGRAVGRKLVGDLAVGFLSRLGSSTGAKGGYRAGAHGPVADSPVAGTGLIGAPRGSADGLVGRAEPMGSMPGTDEG